MTYTDPPMRWPYRGRTVLSCHLTADTVEELHAFARKIGLKRSWFQVSKSGIPHYDLMSDWSRNAAAKAGAIALTRQQAWDRMKSAVGAERVRKPNREGEMSDKAPTCDPLLVPPSEQGQGYCIEHEARPDDWRDISGHNGDVLAELADAVAPRRAGGRA